MKINQSYLYWVPDSRKVCYLAISVSNELLCLGHFLTYWFSPLLTMIWTFCHLWQQYKHENKFIGQIFQDPAKLWSIISLELALKGYGFILKLFFKVSYIEIVTQYQNKQYIWLILNQYKRTDFLRQFVFYFFSISG